MKSLFVILMALSLNSYASSQNLPQFVCMTSKVIEGKSPTEFSFVVENLNQTTGKVGYWAKNDTDEPVKMKPTDSILDLNDNWVISAGSKGLMLNSDGDGCQYTTVLLYKNSDYKSGYVNVTDGGCGAVGVPLYSTVSCKVK